MEYEEILQMADREHPLVYTNKRELISLLTSGILVDWGRRVIHCFIYLKGCFALHFESDEPLVAFSS